MRGGLLPDEGVHERHRVRGELFGENRHDRTGGQRFREQITLGVRTVERRELLGFTDRDREMIRDRSAKMALTLLRYHLIDQKPPF